MKFRIRSQLLWLSLALCCLTALEFIILKHNWGSKESVKEPPEEKISAGEMFQLYNRPVDWRRNARMFKKDPAAQGYLTIGIPTVRRNKSDYFFNTLDSLLNCTEKDDLSEIVIVIFLADFNTTWKEHMFRKIHNKYPQHLKQGTIHIIEAQRDFYPKLENLDKTFNDSESRVKWRSKQNTDYAFLWLYSEKLSKFYIQLEDDVFILPGYLYIIKQFISKQSEGWTCLEFSTMGFIGKLFHSEDLDKLAKIVLLFYDKQPVDFLYLYFNTLNLQKQRIIRRPTIFRHVGYHSSLPGKTMTAVDRFFDNIEKSIKGDNPPAKLFTTMKKSPDFPIENSYSLHDGYFWAHSAPQINDTIHVLFDKPQSVSKVFVLTGSREHQSDKLEHGDLDACLSVKISNNDIKCFNTIKLGTFLNGNINVENVQSIVNNFKITAIQITVTESQTWWLIVKEIAVFIK